MSFVNGVFEINTSGEPVVRGQRVSASVFNSLTQDIASGLSEVFGQSGSLNLKGFGAVGDNSTNDTLAVTTATAIGSQIYVPYGIFKTTYAAYTDITGSFTGVGQLKDNNGAGCQRACEFHNILVTPSSQGHEDSHQTTFTGDWTKIRGVMSNPMELRWGPLATGLVCAAREQYIELCPRYVCITNEAGFNSVSEGGGRSQLNVHRVTIHQDGKGDLCAYNAAIFVGGTNAVSPSSFLNNPAASFMNGSMSTISAGKYMNPFEFGYNDGGFDVAWLGWVDRISRNNSTGALGTAHIGHQIQSLGSESIDSCERWQGKIRMGMDLSGATFETSGTWQQAAFVLPPSARYYGNSTDSTVGSYGLVANVLGDAWFTYESGAWKWIVGGGAAAVLSGTYLSISGGFSPGTPSAAMQSGRQFAGTGAPSNANGSNGDIYVRHDGTAAGKTLFYHKETGSWVPAIP